MSGTYRGRAPVRDHLVVVRDGEPPAREWPSPVGVMGSGGEEDTADVLAGGGGGAEGWRRRPSVHLEIVIPVLNEEWRLPATIAASVSYLARQPWSSALVVVDNGSVDRTLDIAGTYPDAPVPVYTVGCSTRGKGAAVRRGMLGSTSNYVGFMDADLATPIDTLDAVLPLLHEGHVAVIGSRNMWNACRRGQPWSRRLGGWAFRRLTDRLVLDLTDTQCGFKFFRRDMVTQVLTEAKVDGFAFDVELLLLLIAAGHRVVEIPVDWIDAPGSTFSTVRHGLSTFHDVLQLSRPDGTGVR